MRKRIAAALLLLAVPLALLVSSGSAGFWGEGESTVALAAEPAGKPERVYVCPMHPQVRQHSPGECPICGMHLTPEVAPTEPGGAPQDPATRAHADHEYPMVVDAPAAEAGEIIQGVTKSAQSALGLRLSTVESRVIQPRVAAWGRVVADAASERAVTAPADGWVRRIHVQSPGARVAAGAALFEFYSPELAQRQRDYIDALNRRDQLLKSMTDMRGQNGEVLGSLARERRRQRDALLRLGIARSSIDAIETYRRQLESLTIVAPHAGLVTAVNAREGVAVGPATTLYNILDDAAVQLDVILTPSQFNALPAAAQAEFTAGGASTRVPLRLDRAVFNAELQSYAVRTPIAQHPPVLPGAVLDVAVLGCERRGPAVPREALLEGPEGSYVVVVTTEDSFVPRRVTTGAADRHWVGIQEGLHPGDRVVTDGQFMLDAAATFQSAFAGALAD